MQKILPKLILAFLFLGTSNSLKAQDLPVDPNRFDLVFQRGFMLTTSPNDSLPFSPGLSGSWFLGYGFIFDVNPHFGFRLTPGFNWIKLNYKQEAPKRFPTTRTDFDNEKHRVFYVEVPAGIRVTLNQNDKRKSLLFIEGGGFAGLKLGGVYKTIFTDEDAGQTTKYKISGVKDLETWRYGLYGKVGYRWISLYFSYRLSNMFEQFRTVDGSGNETVFPNFEVPPMELGISINL